jgi:EAL domain-containing protein (putative c-di-GMP-specific phosphodiesterase class I)
MDDIIRAGEVLHELNEMGCELAIDDYGTGFSSLAYLKLLPVHALKIDKSFVIDMLEDENDAIIVRSTIDLAHNLGLKVVAEGVENQQALLRLKQLRCDYAQGFHFSPAMPEAEFRDWFSSHVNGDAVALTGGPGSGLSA